VGWGVWGKGLHRLCLRGLSRQSAMEGIILPSESSATAGPGGKVTTPSSSFVSNAARSVRASALSLSNIFDRKDEARVKVNNSFLGGVSSDIPQDVPKAASHKLGLPRSSSAPRPTCYTLSSPPSHLVPPRCSHICPLLRWRGALAPVFAPTCVGSIPQEL